MSAKTLGFTIVFLSCVLAVSADQLCPPRISSPLADEDNKVPECIPAHAAAALQVAQKWEPDSVLLMVEVNDWNGNGEFHVRFSFYSPSNGTGLWVADNHGTPAGQVNWGTQALPMNFLDLYSAVKQAREKGMDTRFDKATLFAWDDGVAWRIMPVDDPDMRIFDIGAIQNTMSENNEDAWMTSWTKFVQELQRVVNENPSSTRFDDFIGKIVWEGHALTRKRDALSMGTVQALFIQMPEASVTLPTGQVIKIQNPLSLVEVQKDTGNDVTITWLNQDVRFEALIVDVSIQDNEVKISLVNGKIEANF